MSPADSPLARRVAALFWRRLPGAAGRFSGTLRAVLTDGDYVLAWPVVAAAAPPLALLLGLLVGAVHPYASALATVLVLVVLAGLGAGLGAAALVGYAAGDLTLSPHSGTGGYLAAAASYLVLAGLLLAAPLVTTSLRQRTQRLLRPGAARLAVGFAVAATLAAWLAFIWAHAAAFLVRPRPGGGADGAAVDTLQRGAGWIALAALLACAARAVLTALAARHPVRTRRPEWVRFRTPPAWPWPVPVVLRAGAFTLLLAGLIGAPLGAAAVFALFVVLGVVRYRLVPAVPGYLRVVDRVPVVLRVAACCVVGYLLALAVAPGGFTSVRVFVALVPALLLGALLLPVPVRTGGVPR